jgi:heparanase 1
MHLRLQCLLALLHATLAELAPAAAPSCDALAIVSIVPVNTLPSYFASFNIDSSRQRSFFDVNFSDPRLTYLASQISGTNIRFGGTGNDFIYYEVPSEPACPPTVPYVNECLNASLLSGLTTIASAARAGLIFGLSLLPFNNSFHPSPYPHPDPEWTWSSTNAAALLRYAKASGIQLWGLELGNEDNSKGFSASQQAAALFKLSAVLDDIYGAGTDRPVLVGPDASGFHVPLPDAHSVSVIAYMTDYLNRTQSILRAITHHEYIELSYSNVLNHSFLDNTRNIARNVISAVRAVNATTEVWAGEIGPANGGGFPNPNCHDNRVCGRFGSSLWYADAMAAVAREGYAAFQRQDFLGADYGLVNYTSFAPSPDYWLLYLWQRRVGSVVLDAHNGKGARAVRMYAFCAQARARVALVLLNVDSAAACVALPADAVAGSNFTQWSLTGGAGGVESADVLLNGVRLALDGGGKVPPTDGAAGSGGTATLPAESVTFLEYDSLLGVCA